MKPIKLKIKGLNSFVEAQEIDFKKLTSKGIFGIFGSTGSGKSTVLDGITLALYGEVARKSSNFMNVNCNSLNVSYEFQISEKKIKTYIVEREFKRENKTGKVRSKSARIMDVTGKLKKVLEEGAKNVTERCEEILGLKLEDFTRTVVLPQGRFSEFLKLEGKDRRNMLERLFSLQKYGDDLSFKLSAKSKEEREKASVLQGQLKGYEGIGAENLKEKAEELERIEKQYGRCKIEYNVVEQKFNDGKELWKLQLELDEKVNERKLLREKEGQINEWEKKVSLAEGALKIKPYMDNFENTLDQIKTIKKELLNLNNKIGVIRENKNKTGIILNEIRDKKDKELPELRVKQQKISDAVEESIILNRLQQEKKLLKKDIEYLKKNLQNKNNEMINDKNYIEELLVNIRKKEETMEILKIPEEYKRKINKGMIMLINYENIMVQKNSLCKDIETCQMNMKAAAGRGEILLKNIEEKKKLLDDNMRKLNKLLEMCPGDENTLLVFQANLSSVKGKCDRYRDYKNSEDKSKGIVQDLKKELKNKCGIKSDLECEIKEVSEKVEKFKRDDLANTLKNTLSEGDSCPVCGSAYHCVKSFNIIDTSSLEKLEIDLNQKENKSRKLTEEIIKIQTNILSEEKNVKEIQKKIKELGEDFKEISVSILQCEFHKLKYNIIEFNDKKSILEKKIKILKEEKTSMDIDYSREITIQEQNKSRLIRLQQDLNTEEEKLKIMEEQLSSLKAELSVENFKSRSNEINDKEKERIKLESEIRKFRNDLDIKRNEKEELNSRVTDLKEKLSEKQAKFQETDKNICEKENSIKNKVGQIVDLEDLNKGISDSIEKIESEYAIAEKNNRKIEKDYDIYNNKIIAAHSSLANLNERNLKERESLEKALKEQPFKDIYEVKKFFMNRLDMNKLREKIQEYKDFLVKLNVTIENLYKNTGGKTLTEGQWIQMQQDKNEKNNELNKLYEAKIKINEEVNSINIKLSELKVLLEKKEKMEHELGLLDDLEKLFKGKKFVEFVAGNQLKYISLEADKKLRQITCENYGLEVDEDGRFFIRDYKNGGKKRDASTLSGGETFVTSLALALALSAQIQLKGTAPLELFFLDEGFGTLDDNLLEIVMDSLEKIHNDKLSIGIISHLEVIKERMPVKLIVSPAEAGMGGSRVKIEIN
ncbi:AAA family ATPase [Clostridium sp. JNZ X4-2]